VHAKKMKKLLDQKVSEEDKEKYFTSYADEILETSHVPIVVRWRVLLQSYTCTVSITCKILLFIFLRYLLI
jgi:hypothetical protein